MTDTLGQLADVNLAAAWVGMGRSAGGAITEVGPLHLVATGIPMEFFNGAFLTAPVDDAEATIRSAVAFMAEQGVPWQLWVRAGLDDELLAAGRRAGLRDAPGPPVMVLDPIPLIPPIPPPLEVTLVSDEAGIEVHCDVAARGFEMPIEIMHRFVTAALLQDEHVGILVGSVGGEPVSTALVSVSGRTAGVYSVATPSEHRRRGYGAAMTWAAVAEGVRRGCDLAVLQSSAMGKPVYAAMGFTEIGQYLWLVSPPVDG